MIYQFNVFLKIFLSFIILQRKVDPYEFNPRFVTYMISLCFYLFQDLNAFSMIDDMPIDSSMYRDLLKKKEKKNSI